MLFAALCAFFNIFTAPVIYIVTYSNATDGDTA